MLITPLCAYTGSHTHTNNKHIHPCTHAYASVEGQSLGQDFRVHVDVKVGLPDVDYEVIHIRVRMSVSMRAFMYACIYRFWLARCHLFMRPCMCAYTCILERLYVCVCVLVCTFTYISACQRLVMTRYHMCVNLGICIFVCMHKYTKIGLPDVVYTYVGIYAFEYQSWPVRPRIV